ncbi:MAG: hypothetical protein Q7Q71_02505 [Verrucomicrobiota bacterium JB023]|nr:hypothetical protein [Verrucomicrobiota bacterium JB023]
MNVLRLLAAAILLLLASCSSSRLVDGSRVFEAGEHPIGTLKSMDVLIEDGAKVHVDYGEACRVFIASGGSLTGLGKGSRNVRVYLEDGAFVSPRLASSSQVVDDIMSAWQERHTRFLPTHAQEPANPAGPRRVHFGGYYGSTYRYDRGYRYHHYHRPSPRPTSVSSSSYRKSN